MASVLYLKNKNRIRSYYLTHKDEIDAYRKNWYKNNYERFKKKCDEWKFNHPDQVLKSKLRWRLNNSFLVRAEILELLGPKCSVCGYDSDQRALQIDHVNGNGKNHRKNNSGTYYRSIKAEILSGSANYQILCCNCNWIKVYENRERKLISQEY